MFLLIIISLLQLSILCNNIYLDFFNMLEASSFSQKIQEAQCGNIQSAYTYFSSLLNSNSSKDSSKKYACLLNKSTLQFQKGLFKNAFESANKATETDPFNYLAYYNKFVFAYATQNYLEAYKQLLLALSCLHSYLAVVIFNKLIEDKKIMKNIDERVQFHLSQCLHYCENNLMGYLVRARIFEQCQKVKLAINQYDTAEQYCRNSKQMVMVYQLRAEFYWRAMRNQFIKSHDNKQSQVYQKSLKQDLEQCFKIQKSVKNLEIFELEPNAQKFDGLQERIKSKCQLFQQLLKQLDSVKQTGSTISQQNKDATINSSKLQVKEKQELQYDQINSSDDENLLQDSSKNISADIEKLEEEIIKHGGKLKVEEPFDTQTQDQQTDRETFLSAQIEKTVEDIERIKSLKLSDARSDDSYSSKNAHRIINLKQLKQFDSADIQIVSAQIFENGKYDSRSGIVILEYQNEKKLNTLQKQQLIWHERFKIKINKQKGENQQLINVILELSARSIWGRKLVIGNGSINLLQMGQNNCLLLNNDKKVGIVYYKMKLQ